jgi:hypothetical protein
MKLCGFQGWTSFWNVIYLDPDHMDDEKLIRHEKKHIEQIQEQGRLKFAVKYTYYTMRYGYRDNPYEIEAREAETSEG